MFRKLTPVATAAALAVLVAGGVSAAASSDEADHGRDFTLLDTTIKDTGVDVDNSNSFTIGDEDIFTDVLKNRAGTKTIGSLTAVCTATDIPAGQQKPTAHCTGTATLPRHAPIRSTGRLRPTHIRPGPHRRHRTL